MRRAMELTAGQWLMLRLYVEDKVTRYVSDEDRESVVQVLKRCFGCTGQLTKKERGTEYGLCEACFKGRVWELN